MACLVQSRAVLVSRRSVTASCQLVVLFLISVADSHQVNCDGMVLDTMLSTDRRYWSGFEEHCWCSVLISPVA